MSIRIIGWYKWWQIMALTAVAVKAAKGRRKPYRLTDSDELRLLVLLAGARYWRVNHRYLGKQKTLALGVWPDIQLVDARTKRDAARRLPHDSGTLARESFHSVFPHSERVADPIATEKAIVPGLTLFPSGANTNCPVRRLVQLDRSYNMAEPGKLLIYCLKTNAKIQ